MQEQIGSPNLEDLKEACVLYVLTSNDISHGKRWYVGSSKSVETIFTEHRRKKIALTSEGCWNIDVIQICEDDRDMRKKELLKTSELAGQFGSCNVRGAYFVSEPFGRPLRALEEAVIHNSNLCFDCMQNFNSEKCCKKRLRRFDAEEEDKKRIKKNEDKISDSRSDEVEIVTSQEDLRKIYSDPKNVNRTAKVKYLDGTEEYKSFGVILQDDSWLVNEWLKKRINSSPTNRKCYYGPQCHFVNWVVCLDDTQLKKLKYFNDEHFQKLLSDARKIDLEDHKQDSEERKREKQRGSSGSKD